MDIKIYENYTEASAEAYGFLLSVLKTNPASVLGLPTGSTPLGLYDCMKKGFAAGDLSYSEITTFNLDEYAGLQPDDPQSYLRFMNDNLFSGIDVPADRINIPSGNGSLEENCAAYDEAIYAAGGIDLQVLGLGGNGHIGFNEPGTAFELTTHIAELHQDTREANSRFFESIDQVPTKAVTMGIKNIMNARKIILIASGPQKAEAVLQTVGGKVSPDCPSSILQMHPDVTMFLDVEAAAKL